MAGSNILLLIAADIKVENSSKLPSVSYKALLLSVHTGMETLRFKWQVDAPGIDNDNWEDMWD